MSINRIGAFAAVVQAVLWLTFIVFILAINPIVGLTGPGDLEDPARLLPVLDSHRIVLLFPALDGLVGLSLLMVVIAAHLLTQHDAGAALSRTALGFGIAAAVGFITLSLARVASLPVLADLYSAQGSAITTIFELTNAVHNAMSAGTRFALGVWLILLAVTALRIRPLPRWLPVFGLILGTVNVASAYVPVVAAPNLVAMPLLFGALAFVLVRAETPEQGAPSGSPFTKAPPRW